MFCPLCGRSVVDAVVLDCGHNLCSWCLDLLAKSALLGLVQSPAGLFSLLDASSSSSSSSYSSSNSSSTSTALGDLVNPSARVTVQVACPHGSCGAKTKISGTLESITSVPSGTAEPAIASGMPRCYGAISGIGRGGGEKSSHEGEGEGVDQPEPREVFLAKIRQIVTEETNRTSKPTPLDETLSPKIASFQNFITGLQTSLSTILSIQESTHESVVLQLKSISSFAESELGAAEEAQASLSQSVAGLCERRDYLYKPVCLRELEHLTCLDHSRWFVEQELIKMLQSASAHKQKPLPGSILCIDCMADFRSICPTPGKANIRLFLDNPILTVAVKQHYSGPSIPAPSKDLKSYLFFEFTYPLDMPDIASDISDFIEVKSLGEQKYQVWFQMPGLLAGKISDIFKYVIGDHQISDVVPGYAVCSISCASILGALGVVYSLNDLKNQNDILALFALIALQAQLTWVGAVHSVAELSIHPVVPCPWLSPVAVLLLNQVAASTGLQVFPDGTAVEDLSSFNFMAQLAQRVEGKPLSSLATSLPSPICSFLQPSPENFQPSTEVESQLRKLLDEAALTRHIPYPGAILCIDCMADFRLLCSEKAGKSDLKIFLENPLIPVAAKQSFSHPSLPTPTAAFLSFVYLELELPSSFEFPELPSELQMEIKKTGGLHRLWVHTPKLGDVRQVLAPMKYVMGDTNAFGTVTPGHAVVNIPAASLLACTILVGLLTLDTLMNKEPLTVFAQIAFQAVIHRIGVSNPVAQLVLHPLVPCAFLSPVAAFACSADYTNDITAPDGTSSKEMKEFDIKEKLGQKVGGEVASPPEPTPNTEQDTVNLLEPPKVPSVCKVILIGDADVGKSCFLCQLTDERFIPTYDTTIGVEFGSKIMEIDGFSLKAQIWDTGGQERFRSITRSYFRGSHAVLLFYDVTSRQSFSGLDNWVQEIRSLCLPDTPVLIVGNKTDKDSMRLVTRNEGETYANAAGVEFTETSSRSYTEVVAAMTKILQKVMSKFSTASCL